MTHASTIRNPYADRKRRVLSLCSKMLVGITILMLCAFAFAVSNAAERTKWSVVNVGSSPFLYDDTLLMGNSAQLNGDLAKISAALSVAVYDQSTINSMLSSMGFSKIVKNDSSYSFADPHHVAYAIGQKTSRDYTIYCIAIRGTQPAYEWWSNFVLDPVNNHHKGFYYAEQEVMTALAEMTQTDGSSSDKRIYLITGHSRGGAVANIMAGQLSAGGSSHVFAYTFACPAVYYGSAPAYSNIYNFNFENDLVPRVPPTSWGYTRYGVDVEANGSSFANMLPKADLDVLISGIAGLKPGSEGQKLLFAMLGWGLSKGSSSSLSTFLDQAFGKSQVYFTLLSQGAGFDQTTSTMMTKYLRMIQFWNTNSDTMSALPSQEWSAYRTAEENKEIFALYDEFAGKSVSSYDQLSALIPQVKSRYSAGSNISSMETVLRMFFDFKANGLPSLKSTFTKFGNAHKVQTYLSWLNQTYYGYKGYAGKTFHGAAMQVNVQTISPRCFEDASGSFALSLNNTVAMGSYAFLNCTGIETLNLPEGFLYIGDHAFENCTSLSRLTIPASLERMGSKCFVGATGLATAGPIGSGRNLEFGWTEEIPFAAFQYGDSFTDILIPNSVTNIQKSAFYGCNNLQSMTLPFTGQSRESTGDAGHFGYIFGWASGKLEGDAYQSSVDYGNKDCYVPSSLTSVEITDAELIPDSAFTSCKYFTTIILPEKLTRIGDGAFFECTRLKNLAIPNNVVSIGVRAFRLCSSLESITMSDSIQNIGHYAFDNCTSLTSITIPISMTKIEDGVFFGCTGLTSITIPDSVTSIGYAAFSHCTGLTSITIPNSVTSIDTAAFGSCTGLTSITIPDSVTSIGSQAFWGCNNLQSMTLPFTGQSRESTGDAGQFRYIFGYSQYETGEQYQGYHAYIPSSLKSVEITDSAWINVASFRYCNYLTSIVLPDTLTGGIGWGAFDGCASLTSITIPSGVNRIDNETFSGCTSLTNIMIPDSVGYIGNDAFRGCTSLASITIPDSVSFIYDGAFSDCTNLVSITIPASVTKIDPNAFYGCTGLISAGPIGGGFNYEFGWETTIPKYAFQYCKALASITIPDGVTTIGEYAFYGCEGLTSLTIPGSVINIGEYAFTDCKSLISADPIGGGFNYEFGWETTIPEKAFKDCTALSSITIPDGVTTIGNFAFYGCEGLTSITIPDSVTTIDYSAFGECAGLTSIMIPNSVTYISKYAFTGCNSITVYCAKDSYAETYARENGFAYTITDEEEQIIVHVEWQDDSNAEGVRPESVRVSLTGQNGGSYPVELAGDGDIWSTSILSMQTMGNYGP